MGPLAIPVTGSSATPFAGPNIRAWTKGSSPGWRVKTRYPLQPISPLSSFRASRSGVRLCSLSRLLSTTISLGDPTEAEAMGQPGRRSSRVTPRAASTRS